MKEILSNYFAEYDKIYTEFTNKKALLLSGVMQEMTINGVMTQKMIDYLYANNLKVTPDNKRIVYRLIDESKGYQSYTEINGKHVATDILPISGATPNDIKAIIVANQKVIDLESGKAKRKGGLPNTIEELEEFQTELIVRIADSGATAEQKLVDSKILNSILNKIRKLQREQR